MIKDLRPEKAFIFRIVHRENLAWTLQHGVHARSSGQVNPAYVDIGNPELIGKRNGRDIAVPPGGTLSDYVPFYFTPRSPMLLNIKTGRHVRQRGNDEIVILVSSLPKIQESGLDFLFTDRHAYLQTAEFHSDLARLDRIDWDILQRSDFKRDNDDLGKFERYQAEALIFQHVPVSALLGIACVNDAVAAQLRQQIAAAGSELKVAATPGWFF
ncbi:type II toxin-antitoxin system toxin DNA ADP-ribosyl transferase DarT [Sphingomonas glacialis]|uniref:DUF4433 domain-containing protein n=1 Tax=Sphingomonas glacialis TaxID=658225 RepID=A0A502FSK2_9SPHN|nr:DUF4433 domain-containing protein [Sphingomonas glacialis]TPG52567.1 DUF4433 domain-containing protein [Sphingomonas glacialis]